MGRVVEIVEEKMGEIEELRHNQVVSGFLDEKIRQRLGVEKLLS